MVKESKKIINPNRFYWNPETKEKIHTEYMDGTPIKLTNDQKKKAEEFAKICSKISQKIVESDVNMKRKPAEKRGKKKEVKSEETEDKKEDNKKSK